MTAAAIRLFRYELDEDLLAASWFAVLGLALSFALIQAYGFDPSAWMY